MPTPQEMVNRLRALEQEATRLRADIERTNPAAPVDPVVAAMRATPQYQALMAPRTPSRSTPARTPDWSCLDGPPHRPTGEAGKTAVTLAAGGVLGTAACVLGGPVAWALVVGACFLTPLCGGRARRGGLE